MTSNAVTIASDATLPAAKLTKRSDFRRLPVVQNWHVVGIIPDRDVKQAMPSDATSLSIWEINYLLTKIKVSEIMSHPVYSLSEDASLEYAAEQLLHYKIGGMPVMFGDQFLITRVCLNHSRKLVNSRSRYCSHQSRIPCVREGEPMVFSVGVHLFTSTSCAKEKEERKSKSKTLTKRVKKLKIPRCIGQKNQLQAVLL